MNSEETQAFAERLMREVWEPYNAAAVAQFYHPDVRGHNRSQRLGFADVVTRLQTDPARYGGGTYHIEDLIAAADKFAIRFRYRATVEHTTAPVDEDVMYFYHLTDGKISEFWVLADAAFDYKANP